MSDRPVVEVDHVSKRYQLGAINHGTLRQDLQSWWARVNGRPDPNMPVSEGLFDGNKDDETAQEVDEAREEKGEREPVARAFDALHDVSFSLNEGETLGIVGKNGAGKSTLLKILCRVTAPTRGSVRIRGRIASLLEVGTGFHPDLTGAENVYLNGSILGMPKAEIRKKFDEIVSFSGLEKFIDTPVKRYSSGMYVRLAFSVAAHLESEILIVDEVLAVGDFEFQRKCLEKLKEVTTGNKTVIIVSHNMSAIQNLCSRAIFLERGRVVTAGSPEETITGYIARDEDPVQEDVSLQERQQRSGSGRFRFADVRFSAGAAGPQTGAPLTIEVDIANPGPDAVPDVDIALGLDNHLGERAGLLTTNSWKKSIASLQPGIKTIRFEFPRLPLTSGHYNMTLFGNSGTEVCDWVPAAAPFNVASGNFYGDNHYHIPPGQGNILLDYRVEHPN